MSNPIKGCEELCLLFGVTAKELNNLVLDHVIPPPANGAYNFGNCVAAYIAYLKDKRFRADTKECAAVLGITEEGVRKLVRESGMPRHARGIFDLTVTGPWYFNMWKVKAAGGAASSDITEERKLLLREQRMKAALERQSIERTKIDAGECLEGWTLLSGMFVSGLNAFVAQASQTIVNVETPAEARAILKAAAHNVQDEIADTLSELAKGFRGNGLDDPALPA